MSVQRSCDRCGKKVAFSGEAFAVNGYLAGYWAFQKKKKDPPPISKELCVTCYRQLIDFMMEQKLKAEDFIATPKDGWLSRLIGYFS